MQEETGKKQEGANFSMFESVQPSGMSQSVKSNDFFGQINASGVRDSALSKRPSEDIDINMFASARSKNSENSQSVASSIKSIPKLDNEK